MTATEIAELLSHVATLGAALVAVRGVNAWRREHRGVREIELAEEALELFYRADDAIRYVRNPGSFSSETDEVVRGERESDKQFQARKNAFIVFKRFRDHEDTLSRLHALRYRFMAVFGADASEPFDDLNGVIHDIRGAAMILTRMWAREHFRDDKDIEDHGEKLRQYEAIFWSGFDDDPIPPRVTACVRAIEQACRAIIDRGQPGYAKLLDRLTSRRGGA